MFALFGVPHFKAGSNWPVITMGYFTSLGAVLFGIDTGMISGIIAMAPFKRKYGEFDQTTGTYYLSSGRQSLIVSIMSVGLFLGSMFSGHVADCLGRKRGILFGCLVFTIGVIVQLVHENVAPLCVGRVIAGTGAGVVGAIGPLYQAEIAPKQLRGSISGSFFTCRTLGVFLASVINNATKSRPDRSSYLLPIGLQLVWAGVLVTGFIFIPESPRYYIKTGEKMKAKKALAVVRHRPVGDPELEHELAETETNLLLEQSMATGSVLDCFRNQNRQLHRLAVGVFGLMFLQLVGVNFIKYYGTVYFQSAGIQNAFAIQMAVNSVSVGSTIISLFLIERTGRRFLLLVGSFGCFATQFIIAIVGVVLPSSTIANWVLVAFACIYIFFEAAGIGPPIWVVTGESFSLKTRAKSIALSAASDYLFAFVVSFITPYLIDSTPGGANLGPKVFFIWGSCSLAMTFFVYFWIFETKGYSLEQVDELYANVKYAWKSASYVPTVIPPEPLNEKAENVQNENCNEA
ncbi:general substrate transporter [Lipomyces kononenkoae]|uniref:General substrate transporter n=1 Tax=Lipomyces kononenkoae TaxID=34357 RepID=A0ACC3SQE0_LIPKO